jgi:dienelactone hydrolase
MDWSGGLVPERRGYGSVAMIGWSFGGIVTTFAVSRSDRYRGAVIQAPGALNWARSDALREAMTAAAARINTPLQCLVAENDLTTDSARTVCAAAKKSGATTELKIYPPFTPSTPAQNSNAQGHALFSAQGVSIWKDDVLRFLAAHVR